MRPEAHYAQARWWNDRLVQGRMLTDRRIAYYQIRGRYARGQLKAPGGTPLGRLVYSA
jgi:hypothetical protein